MNALRIHKFFLRRKNMKQFKTLVLCLALAGLAALPVFGGGRQGASGPQGAANPGELRGEISYWTAWAPNSGVASWIAEFTMIDPNVKVTPIQYPNSVEGNLKVNASLMAGQEIDVVLNYNLYNFLGRAQSGLFQDLSGFLREDNLNMADEWGLEYKTDGKIFGLPATGQTDKIYINKKKFAEAGIPVPETWTMEQYIEIARKLTRGSGTGKVYGTSDMQSGQMYWSRFARGVLGSNFYYNSEGLSNFDHPAFALSLQHKFDMEEKEKIQFPYLEYKSSGLSAWDTFMGGRVAMTVASVGIARYIKDTEKYPRDFEAGVLPMPLLSGNGKNYNDGIYVFSFLGISAKTKNPRAAWEFCKWMSTRGAEGFAEVGHVPLWKRTDKEKIISIMFGNNAAELIDINQVKNNLLNYNGATYLDDHQLAYTEIESAARTEMEYVMTGEKNVSAAISAMKAEADRAIRAAK
jgi:multiple sugar transport system substrate-binding protein